MIWVATMFLDDFDMLECQQEALEGVQAVTVIAEAAMTHRGDPKPLHLQADPSRWRRWADRIVPVTARGLPLADADHWGREHAQRNAAWPAIEKLYPEDSDPVLVVDGDEIPSRELLDYLPGWAREHGSFAISVPMRTTVFAVDWEAAGPLPPTCVAATVRSVRRHGGDLAGIRDRREAYPRFEGSGGWHLGWTGGPERQREKLLHTTCHVEMIGSPEGELIASGERWRTANDGGGLPVKPVDVDESWPAYVYERRCPENWFRPRENT